MRPPLLVGITATRSGLTGPQVERLLDLLTRGEVAELHHGDCVGGDADADGVAAALGIRRVAHPPTNAALRAFRPAEVVLDPEEYKARNRSIVLATCPLVALPAQAREARFGGTWSTVRFARSARRPVLLVLPNGDVVAERTHGAYLGY